jgi:hypothetical protein
MPEQLPLVASARPRVARSDPDQVAKKLAIARRTKPSTRPGHVKLTLTLDVPRELAERLSARAIREEKNLEGRGDRAARPRESRRGAVMNLDLDVTAALAVLADVKARCHREDMRTPAVLAALDLLEARAGIAWPFAQFRRSLASPGARTRSTPRPRDGGRW